MKTHLLKKPVLPEDVGMPAYFPVHPSDVDYINKHGDGEIMQAEIKRDRYYPLTKKYWALCNLIAENAKLPDYDNLNLNTKAKVDEYIKLKLKVVKGYMVFPDRCPHCGHNRDIVHVITGSISNAAKDKDQFQSYYDKAVEIMSEVSGISADELEFDWMRFECEVE